MYSRMSVTTLGGRSYLLNCVEHGQHAARIQPRRGGIPERERRQPIGVDVLGRLLQLGELRQRIARLGVERMIHLQQYRAVALDDQSDWWSVLARLVTRPTASLSEEVGRLVLDTSTRRASAAQR